MPTCPNQHSSDAADFCSVCGVQIVAAGAPAAAPGATAPACPDCAAPREHLNQAFCEICGYNFRTGTKGTPMGAGAPPPTPVAPSGAVPKADPPQTPSSPPPAASGSQPSPASGTKTPLAAALWDIHITIDPNLYGTPAPDAPAGLPDQLFTLFEAESLIGRADTDVRVQVPINHDSGVSRRQAMLTQRDDGTLFVRDVGSTNGTQLNGVDLTRGVETPVKHGDVLAVGAWTKLTVRRKDQ